MVAEMVVSILHCDTKNDSFPEFPQVGVRLSAVLHDEFGNIKITGSVLIIGSIRFAGNVIAEAKWIRRLPLRSKRLVRKVEPFLENLSSRHSGDGGRLALPVDV